MKTILMTVLATMTTAAFAQEATPDTWLTEARSTLSRAEVRADTIAAQQSGLLALLEDPAYMPGVTGSRLRAEVVADLMRARESGEFAMISGEAYDFQALPRTRVYAARQADGAER